MTTASKLLALFALTLVFACSESTPPDPMVVGCGGGKCDDATPSPAYEADIAALNARWPGTTPMETVEDAFRVTVVLGEQQLVADTHLFGTDVNVIPYDDGDMATDVDGNPVGAGDAVIAQYFARGDIGIAVKHHRPEHRLLSLESSSADDMKEDFKLQDTHIEIVVGVDRNGQNGAITLNNPQDYQEGRFGDSIYPMMFLRPVYPDYLNDEQQVAFRDNIRTMLLGFNAVSNFPGDYNGGDPLAARDPERVREHASQMVRAIAGDADARAWFMDPANLVYCAELAHVSFSAGLITPLNAATFVPLVGEETWAAFTSELANHQDGQPSAFTDLNRNPLAMLVDATLAPDDLLPAAGYAPSGSPASGQIAFQPMTMADIVESFMATHIPRDVMGEGVAPIQAAVLTQMKPGLLEAMAMDMVPETDPRRIAVDMLFDQVLMVVGTSYGSYDEFRSNLEPVLAQARLVTGPRDGSGNGLFVPPSLMHLVAQGRFSDGLMGLRYVGHGIHWSMVRPAGGGGTGPTDPPPVDPPTGGTLLSESGELAQGEELRYEVVVGEGMSRLTFVMETAGDADLYVRRDEAPTLETFDCRPYDGADRTETCEFAPPGEGTFHVMVRGYSEAVFELEAVAQ